MNATVTLRVPKEWEDEASSHWKRLRQAEGLPADANLKDGEIVDRFDGAAVVEWIIPLTEAIVPLLTAVLGFLVARKGEVEIRDGDQMFKFTNLQPKKIQKVMEVINGCRLGS